MRCRDDSRVILMAISRLFGITHVSQRMPRISDIPGPYRLFFYSIDCNEPAHVHVRRERYHSKIWLADIRIAFNNGFSARDLVRIRRVIFEHRPRILEAWREHCRTDDQ